MVRDLDEFLTAGCGSCLAACLADGAKKFGTLDGQLKIPRRMEGHVIDIRVLTVERQCDMEFWKRWPVPRAMAWHKGNSKSGKIGLCARWLTTDAQAVLVAIGS